LRGYFGEFLTAGPKDRDDGKKENKGEGKLRKEEIL
jgi:hypothetical protein